MFRVAVGFRSCSETTWSFDNTLPLGESGSQARREDVSSNEVVSDQILSWVPDGWSDLQSQALPP